MAHKKKAWGPHPSERGSETRRAKRAGRSLKAQAEHDEHSPDKRIRGKGIFALNAMNHKFKHKGKRNANPTLGKGKAKAKRTRKAVRRKKA